MAVKTTFNLPESQEREYIRTLLGFSKSLQVDCNNVLLPMIGELKHGFESDIKKDSWGDDLDQIINQLVILAGQSIGIIVTKLPNQYEAVSKFNNGQFKLVVKANTGLEIPTVMQGAPRAVSLDAVVQFEPPSEDCVFTPFCDLTHDQVIAWLGADEALMAGHTSQIDSQLELMSRTISDGEIVDLPWSTT